MGVWQAAAVFCLLVCVWSLAGADNVLIQEMASLPSADRARVIKAAIASVNEQVKISSEVLGNGRIRTQNRLKDPAIDAQGLSRVRLEKTVRKAEADLIRLRYKDALQSSDRSVRVEALARVAFHRLGSLLSRSEIRMIQEETSQCSPPAQPRCDSFLKQRSIDGTCNNLARPLQGAAGQNFRRLIAARYEDGISQPRGFLQSKGNDLAGRDEFSPPNPSPREVSRTVLRPQPEDDPIHSHMIMQWGQFLDHDLDLAPEFGEHDCPPESCIATEKCFPIRKVSDDPSFTSLPCLFFGRSIPSCNPADGEFPAREQFNAITHYIDASNVYGSSQGVARELRELQGGRLKTGPPHTPGAKPSLPLLSREELEKIEREGTFLTLCPEPLEKCYVAGDVRVNEHLALTAMHTIWLREHNRIVAQLSRLQPGQTDEQLYQTARSVVGGEMQAIIYQEYLPEVLGSTVVEKLILSPALTGGYDSSVDPSVPNSYAAAAFRYGHSLIRPEFARLDEKNRPLPAGPLNLLDSFFDPSQYNTSLGTDPVLRGLLAEAARRADEFLTPVLTTQLFASGSFDGRDLGALNINRGRDHGLPPYLVWREFCVRYWKEQGLQVRPQFRSELTQLELTRVYGSLDSVDLFAGAMAEEPFVHPANGEKSIIGPTFTCIFAINYRAMAQGDRFFYQFPTYSPNQVAQLKKTSLSRVICDNSDGIAHIQPNAFLRASKTNGPVYCSSLPSLDLSAFATIGCEKYIKLSLWLPAYTWLRGIVMMDKPTYDSHTSQFFSLSRGTQCVKISCPVKYSKVIAYIARGQPIRPSVTPGLAASLKFNGKYLAGVVPLAKMAATNGIYDSAVQCRSGRVVAVRYGHPAVSHHFKTTKQEAPQTTDGQVPTGISDEESILRLVESTTIPVQEPVDAYDDDDAVDGSEYGEYEDSSSNQPSAAVSEEGEKDSASRADAGLQEAAGATLDQDLEDALSALQ
uniref:Peroxidase-like protein n=1 Tax=Halisarca dujardinii TaxID=2583056 RepID=A0AA96MKD6_HALDU|nr:peroxidase-like protein [Halisarca dujardinii]